MPPAVARTQSGVEASCANRSARQALWRTILALLGLGALAMALAFLAARRQAARLTRPIQELQAAAGAIARGDYGRAVAVSSDDEIGLLAADFDTMRRTVKEYTERLEDMVAGKVAHAGPLSELTRGGRPLEAALRSLYAGEPLA